MSTKIATYEEVKDLPNHPEILLVDVREPNELQMTGQIPTSINVPLGEVQIAFSDSTTNDQFKMKYGKDKPEAQTPIITSCKSGMRSEKAYNTLINLGYVNVSSYSGSWTGWAEREGL